MVGPREPIFGEDLAQAIAEIRTPIHVVQHPSGHVGVGFAGEVIPTRMVNGHPTLSLLATLPALYPEWLGDRSFNETHGVRFPYVTGAMANGIATTDIVIAMARANMLGFFGAAGLAYRKVEAALDRITSAIGSADLTWGMNLIHSPAEPALEEAVADLYLRRGVRRVSAAAYLSLTPAIVRYAVSGLSQRPDGSIDRRNFVFAKNSRPEVARHFLTPAPKAMLDALVREGKITADEARLAAHVPIAEDITVEADSGGHTDNQALTAVFPVISELRDALAAEFGYTRPIRIGAAGGLGTPRSVAAAFSLGAAYVLTGSVNQASVESGLSPAGKAMLATAAMTDVGMAPAADMFEQGVEVQVLKRGTMFAVRGHRLYEAYRNYESLDAIPATERAKLEKQVLGATFDEVRASTHAFWADRDPAQNDEAAKDPKHEMALCFRWYLGLSSRWAIVGEESRRMDFQIWCGPAMGAFNDWVRGSHLEPLENRSVVQIALNLLEGAAVLTRAHQLRSYGAPVPQRAFRFVPRPLT
ncbi:MAG: PfaD family polyunsaturated fatty acid/polyketide biosynthesis protein [Myxococcota bacterium]